MVVEMHKRIGWGGRVCRRFAWHAVCWGRICRAVGSGGGRGGLPRRGERMHAAAQRFARSSFVQGIHTKVVQQTKHKQALLHQGFHCSHLIGGFGG
jgi:hypothetical protein